MPVLKIALLKGRSPRDLVYFVENADVDWSFGLGRAQFVTLEL